MKDLIELDMLNKANQLETNRIQLENAKITLEKLQSKTLVVLDISSTNSVKKIKLGIRSTESADY